MPYYDYKCSTCENVFEVFHSIAESPDISCPKCQKSAKKLITSNVGIAFKGSGFHVNDYKGSGASSSAPAPAATPPVTSSPESK